MLLMLVGMAASAIVALGASFLYVLALAAVWIVLIVLSKVFSKREEEDAEDSVSE
jgi:hypothetical protein